jgi:hypothetical protein
LIAHTFYRKYLAFLRCFLILGHYFSFSQSKEFAKEKATFGDWRIETKFLVKRFYREMIFINMLMKDG